MNSDEVLNVKKSEQGVDAATLNKKKKKGSNGEFEKPNRFLSSEA